MPKYTNKFATPTFVQQKIVTSEGQVMGYIRIKPSSVLWKPTGQHKYYSVPLSDFTTWITNTTTKATRTTS